MVISTFQQKDDHFFSVVTKKKKLIIENHALLIIYYVLIKYTTLFLELISSKSSSIYKPNYFYLTSAIYGKILPVLFLYDIFLCLCAAQA